MRRAMELLILSEDEAYYNYAQTMEICENLDAGDSLGDLGYLDAFSELVIREYFSDPDFGKKLASEWKEALNFHFEVCGRPRINILTLLDDVKSRLCDIEFLDPIYF